MSQRTLGITGACMLSIWAAAAAAQTAPPTPGAVVDTLKPPPALPQPSASPVIREQRPGAPASVAAGGKAVAIRAFEFSGNTRFGAEELAAVVAPYTGRPLTLLEIYEAADAVTEHYVAAGYTLASVNVPAQKVSEGVIRLEVLEGRVGRIEVEGAERYTAPHLADYLGEVRKGEVYRGSALEAGMIRINELPGLSARALLRPGEAYGSSDVVIQAQEDLFAGSLLVDNYGRDNVGEFRTTASATLNNPLGVEDQFTVLGLVSEDALLKYGYIAYSLPVNFRGTRLEMSYGEAEFEVDGNDFFGIEGSNKSLRLALSHPLLRTRTDRLVASAGISNTNSNADLFGNTFSGTDITLLELGSSYSHTYSSLAVTQLTAALASNFDEATAEELADPENKADQRLRVELDLQHLQPVPGKTLQVLLRLNGVYSPDPLADTQQVSLGGPGNVRGYAASEARGDRGYFGSVTLRQPFSLGKVNLSGRVFADAGKVSTVDRGDFDGESTLSSVGLGVDAQYARLSAKLDWSFARDEQPVEDFEKDRLFGSVSVSF